MRWVRTFLLGILTLVVAVPAVAWAQALNDSEQPGSALVFHQFIAGTVLTPDQLELPATELEISVTCPKGTTCADHQAVRVRVQWVCPGDGAGVCPGTAFDLNTSVKGTLVFSPEDVNVTHPPCGRGYVIAWVIDVSGEPIKFDGLIGTAAIRRSELGAGAYNALPIQAAEFLATGTSTDRNGDGKLAFNGLEYKAITGKIFGTVRYEQEILNNLDQPLAEIHTSLTLLTLDVVSNHHNNLTSVDLSFFNEHEEFKPGAADFVCWARLRLHDINHDLTTFFGRKGLVESTAARQNGQPVTLLGIVDTREIWLQPVKLFGSCTEICAATGVDPTLCATLCAPFLTANVDVGRREYSYSLYNDGVPVVTTFAPSPNPSQQAASSAASLAAPSSAPNPAPQAASGPAPLAAPSPAPIAAPSPTPGL